MAASTFLHTAPMQVGYGRIGSHGLREETRFRELLARDRGFRVVYSTEADLLYKLDAIVWHRANALLPPVGIQFTLNPDQEKLMSAMKAVERSGIVSRFLYVQTADCPMDEEVAQLIGTLVSHVASVRAEQVFFSVVVARETRGPFVRSCRVVANSPTQFAGTECHQKETVCLKIA